MHTLLFHKKLSLCLLITLFCFSCKKFITVSPPDTAVTAANVFSDDATATSAVMGIYTQVMGNTLFFMNGATTLYPSLSSDELSLTSPNPDLEGFADNALSPQSSILQNNLWGKAYQYIYQMNACLQGLQGSSSLSPSVKEELTGEVKFLRATSYFYLANLFGAVPLELGTDYTVNAQMPRNSIAEIYAQIITDLKDAETELGENYLTPDLIRPNKFAAAAMLARVYLYMKDWADAETYASEVINSGSYQLVTDPAGVFVSGSTETIWQMMPVLPGENTAEGLAFIPASPGTVPDYAVTSVLLNAFEPGDLRKSAWLDSTTVNGMTYYFPFKYKVRDGSDLTEYNIVLRLAEQYLIRAEARAEQNNLTEAVADINLIRERAGLSPLTAAISQASCLAAVMQERRIELFAEWGHRWFDLKRTGMADAVLSVEKSGWKPSAALYPIPYNEIQSNVRLTQNPGY